MRKLRFLLLAVVAFVSSALWLSAQRLSGGVLLGSARRLLSRAQDAFTPKRFLPVEAAAKNPPLPQNRSHFRAIERIHSLQAGMERSNAYNPYFQYVLFPPDGWYPALIVADAFLQCDGVPSPSIVLMGRHYKQRPDHNHSAVRLIVKFDGVERELIGSWYETRNYESVAIGTFPLPADWRVCGAADLKAKSLDTTIDYFGNTTNFQLVRTAAPPRSTWAMVAVFSFSRHLLRMWMTYWHTIGVDTFYLYYNGNSEDIPTIERELADMPFSIVIVDWQVLHWIMTDVEDITCGQPIAINEAVLRWGHNHDFMAFYDTDEFLVTPDSDDLNHFVQRFTKTNGPFLALRSMCAWSMLNATTIGTIANATLPDLVKLNIERGPASGREKYFLNTSALKHYGVRSINMHGIYSHNQNGMPGNAWILRGEGNLAGYHLHFLNEVDTSRVNDYRYVFMPKVPSIERHVGDFIIRALETRIKRKEEARHH